MLATYRCCACKHVWQQTPKAVECPVCGHIWVEWTNYEAWAKAHGKN